MDVIVKEELWRSIGIFWFALIVPVFILRDILKPSLFSLLILPLVITLFIFGFFVFIRKKSSRGTFFTYLIVGLLMINAGIFIGFSHGFKSPTILLLSVGIGSFVYGISKLLQTHPRR